MINNGYTLSNAENKTPRADRGVYWVDYSGEKPEDFGLIKRTIC
jgi:hypothetical protein